MRLALSDPALLGAVLAGDSWAAWRVMLIAICGEPLGSDEQEIFHRFTGRTVPPDAMVDEACFVIGRRGGKDRAASVLSAYLAGLCDHSDALSAGERGTLVCLGADQRQAGIQLNYIEGAFAASPMLRTIIANRTSDTLELTNGINVEVRAASFRRVRGVTAIGVVATEIAFWHSDDSANPDLEVLAALRPALATTGGPLIMISSPYAKKGELWNTHKRHYGPDGDPQILVAQGASADFNPTLPARVVARAYERDPASAAAEFGAQFRNDIAAFVTHEAVDACTTPGVLERPREMGVTYSAFVDPSGGASDSMTLAIAHSEPDRNSGRSIAVLDATREVRAPFSPDDVVAEFATVLKSYGIRTVRGDRYGAEWIREAFAKQVINYRPADLSKSDIYRDFLPRLNSGEVDLLDIPRLRTQFLGLERRTARGGRDSIDHAPGAKDDLANAAAGVLVYETSVRHKPAVAASGYWGNGRIEMVGSDSQRVSTSSDVAKYAPRPRPPEFVSLRNVTTGSVENFHRTDAKEIMATSKNYEPTGDAA